MKEIKEKKITKNIKIRDIRRMVCARRCSILLFNIGMHCYIITGGCYIFMYISWNIVII